MSDMREFGGLSEPRVGVADHDQDDPASIISETFRTELVRRVMDIGKVTIFRELNPTQQFSVIAGGTLMGLVAVAFHMGADNRPETRAQFIRALHNLLDAAAKVAGEKI